MIPWKLVGASWLGLGSFWRGDWDTARSHIARSLEFERQMRHPTTAWSIWSNAVMVGAYVGQEDAVELLEARSASLPRPGQRNSIGAWALSLKTVEAWVLFGRHERAAALYPLVLEALDTGTVIEFQTMELLQKAAGMAAAAGEQWGAARDHYETALGQADELPHQIARPEVRRWYGQMLANSSASGDRDRARVLLGEAGESYERLGMPRHVEMVNESLKAL